MCKYIYTQGETTDRQRIQIILQASFCKQVLKILSTIKAVFLHQLLDVFSYNTIKMATFVFYVIDTLNLFI